MSILSKEENKRLAKHRVAILLTNAMPYSFLTRNIDAMTEAQLQDIASGAHAFNVMVERIRTEVEKAESEAAWAAETAKHNQAVIDKQSLKDRIEMKGMEYDKRMKQGGK